MVQLKGFCTDLIREFNLWITLKIKLIYNRDAQHQKVIYFKIKIQFRDQEHFHIWEGIAELIQITCNNLTCLQRSKLQGNRFHIKTVMNLYVYRGYYNNYIITVFMLIAIINFAISI